jgi:uncharacterized oligopeptide transporter (OPT) family protein
MAEPQAPETVVKETQSHFPALSAAEWITFGLLAGALSVTNIYTVLLIGWGDGGSIIAVLAAVAMLGALGKKATVATLNLGQTMASAGGSVGFAVASYAAVKLVKPDFDPPMGWLIVLFFFMGLLGTMIGSSVRSYMVRYFFPSGTACAIIQKTVTAHGEEARRPVRLMMVWSAIASVVTVPTKIAFEKGAHALIPYIPTGWKGHNVAADPLLFGIGIVVGPRIGVGILIGGLAPELLILPALESAGMEAGFGDWVKWSAIAVLTLPTFATILFAYLFRQPAVVPPGFTPGRTEYTAPKGRTLLYAGIGLVSTLALAIAAQVIFDLSWVLTILTIAVAWPLCVMNGRVTGDTDINPVRLVAIVLLSLFAVAVSNKVAGGDATGATVTLLGIAIIGGTLASMAVDMMQDYRTGYLVEANPTHQTTVQFFGTAVGALVSVPFIFLLLDKMSIGPGSSLPAPGATIWATMAEALSGGFEFTNPLIIGIVAISIIGSAYAFLTVWPRTARFMPSIFGIGIGLLLGFGACAAIFLGGMIKAAVSYAYTKDKRGEVREEAAASAGNDTMMVGASIFAAAAVLSVVLIVITAVLEQLGLDWFFMAGH